MEAIDFRKLRREAKNKRRQNSRGTSNETAQAMRAFSLPSTAPTTRQPPPQWRHPEGFLVMKRLSLECLCRNPKSISYSDVVFTTGGRPADAALSPTVALVEWLENLPSGESGVENWKTMTYGKRRVCMFGEEGVALPSPLDDIAQHLVDEGVFPATERPNHVLLNEYQPGQGILSHTDGPLYASRTATLSLLSSVLVEFTQRLSSEEIGNTPVRPISVLLRPGSLLVFEDEAYLNYCHSIAMDVDQDVTTEECMNAKPGQVIPRHKRFSLTFRHRKK